MLEICSDLSKTDLKIYYFCQHSKKAKKGPNGQTILFLANSFKKRPNGNPDFDNNIDNKIRSTHKQNFTLTQCFSTFFKLRNL